MVSRGMYADVEPAETSGCLRRCGPVRGRRSDTAPGLRKDPLITTSTEFSHPLVDETRPGMVPPPREDRYGTLFLQPAYDTPPATDDWSDWSDWTEPRPRQRRPAETHRRRQPRR